MRIAGADIKDRDRSGQYSGTCGRPFHGGFFLNSNLFAYAIFQKVKNVLLFADEKVSEGARGGSRWL